MRIPWEELEGGADQGLEMTFRGEGDWGVSTLRGYYERGQLTDDPPERDPYVTLFDTEAAALSYARKRARAASGTSYYVMDYRPDPDEPAIVYRVLRTHLGQKQRKKGAGDTSMLEASREVVGVFINVRDPIPGTDPPQKRIEYPDGTVIYGQPNLIGRKDGDYIRWKMLPGLTEEIVDIEIQREEQARKTGRIVDPKKPEKTPVRSLSPLERMVARMQTEGYNADEIAIAVRNYLRKQQSKGGMSGLSEDDGDRIERYYTYPDGTEVVIFVYPVCDAAAFELLIDRPDGSVQRFTGQEPGDTQNAEAAARRILIRNLSRKP